MEWFVRRSFFGSSLGKVMLLRALSPSSPWPTSPQAPGVWAAPGHSSCLLFCRPWGQWVFGDWGKTGKWGDFLLPRWWGGTEPWGRIGASLRTTWDLLQWPKKWEQPGGEWLRGVDAEGREQRPSCEPEISGEWDELALRIDRVGLCLRIRVHFQGRKAQWVLGPHQLDQHLLGKVSQLFYSAPLYEGLYDSEEDYHHLSEISQKSPLGRAIDGHFWWSEDPARGLGSHLDFPPVSFAQLPYVGWGELFASPEPTPERNQTLESGTAKVPLQVPAQCRD